MNAVRIIAMLLVVVAVAAMVGASDKPWFDMENCDFCVNLVSKEGLMDNMTWNHYLTKNGLMSVTVVKGDYREAYGQAMKEMMAVGEKMKSGEKVKMCGFCTTYGELAAAGVNFENFSTEAGDITLMSHTDPEVVKKIHTFGQKTIDAMAMMHEGHEHPETEK